MLGWLTPETKYLQLNSGNVTFSEVIPSVRKCVADVRAKHPDLDLVIGMSHTGGRAYDGLELCHARTCMCVRACARACLAGWQASGVRRSPVAQYQGPPGLPGG